MCGRFTVLTREELADAVAHVERRLALGGFGSEGLQRVSAFEPAIARANAYPGSVIAALGLRDAVASGSPIDFGDAAKLVAAADFTWGFPVDWQKGSVFNTRIESALSGAGMWRDAFAHGRCVVPAATFFEPHATETMRSERTGKQVKRPYEFAMADGSPLMLAGVCADGHCSVVTTEPNEWVAPVHKRMPLALSFAEVTHWLEGDIAGLADRSALELTVKPVGQLEDGGQEAPAADQLSLF